MNNIVYRELGVKTNTGFKRNIIITREENIDTFRTQHKNTDVYATVYSYDKEDIRDAKQQGPLYFDFDGETAQEDIKAVIQFLLKQDCPKESIRVFFSGNKGFHLEIPFNALGISSHKQLNVVNEIIAKELAQKTHSVSIDLKIYDNVRLWRLVNSINSKSGLYKIPLTIEELELPLEEIKTLAQSSRDNLQYPQPVVWDKYNAIFKTISSLRKTNSLQNNAFQPVQEGERNNMMFKRALRLKGLGRTFEEALETCLSIQDVPPLPRNEIERTVRSAYNDRYVVQNFQDRNDKKREIETSFYKALDGAICEQIHDATLQESFFQVFKNGNIERKSYYQDGEIVIRPITGDSVQKQVKLPTGVIEYKNENELIDKIKSFIHKYVDISPKWEEWIAYYVLLTWVYDKLPICPYLCALGPSDTGKSRLVQTVGNICYKPYIASGSITVSSIFRTIDQFKGTLVLNEFDHIGDYYSEIIIIFNNGFEKGFPVTRTEGDKVRKVTSYDVYGPKIFSSRKRKNDWAFESRLLTIRMKGTNRKEIPSLLFEEFYQEAEELRNMLLYFRLTHYQKEVVLQDDYFPDIKGRLKQTLLALTSVIEDEQILKKAYKLALELGEELKRLREEDIDAVIYRELRSSWLIGDYKPAIKEITRRVKDAMGINNITPSAVGRVIRDELGFKTKRGAANGGYVAIITQAKIEYLKDKYEIDNEDDSTESTEQSELVKEDEQLDLDCTDNT